ncbi:MAG: hypothetical protein ACK45B_07510 [Limisphaerales bacterium]
MSASHSSQKLPPPLDLSRLARLPGRLIAVGAVLTVLGLGLSLKYSPHGIVQFGYSWLVAFMFVLSLGLGALFLVLVHHLFDAGWSVPPRRFLEHIASLLFPWMAIFFVPLALLAPRIYGWMTADPHLDHAVHAKLPLFTTVGFYAVVVVNFLVWWVLSRGLRKWSIAQDATGDAKCTFKMRAYSYWGIFAFAITATLAAIMWMKALQHQWFSTMYGVWYFAGSVWLTLGTAYTIMALLDRQRVLTHVLHDHQFYFMGTLFFAFTVFYTYVTFSQYFIIWNANIPEETFWYWLREQGNWFWVSMVIIFGHFFLPFLTMLRIDVKCTPLIMIPLAGWAWVMHYTDLAFNIMPVLHPEGFPLRWFWLDLGILALMVGILAKVFLAKYHSAAPYPLKDPRLIEAMGLAHPVATQISGGELDETDDLLDGPEHVKGGQS